MRQTCLTALILVVSISAAQSETPLNQDATRALISGNTLYVEVPEGTPGAPKGGVAPIFYDENGQSAAQLPGGPKLTGTWMLASNGYCIDWDNGPKNSCSTLTRGADQFVVTDAKTGEARGTVARIATGNPENL